MSFFQLIREEGAKCEEVERLLKSGSVDLKSRLELQWKSFKSVAEPGFIKKFCHKPHEFWWEMYFGGELANAGMNVARLDTNPDVGGPDFVCNSGYRIFFECVCPDRGAPSNPDRIDDPVMGEARFYPRGQTIMRLQRSINDKSSSFKRYIDDGIVEESDRCVIALSCSRLDHPGHDVLAASVLPIGSFTVTLDQDGNVLNTGFDKESYIERLSGYKVYKTGFTDNSLEHISGLIFYSGSIFNTSSPNPDLLFLGNLNASNCIGTSDIPFAKDMREQAQP